MKISLIAIILIQILALTFNSAQARDPNVFDEPDYGERMIVGGSEWTGGDTFLAITLPLVIVAIIALPHIFDGKDQEWPVHKFDLFNFTEHPRIMNKFPTRQLCESY